MKLSEAIKELEAAIVEINHPRDFDRLNALNLAIGCLSFRLAMKEKWRQSTYDRLLGEDDE